MSHCSLILLGTRIRDASCQGLAAYQWGLVSRKEMNRVWRLYLSILYHTFETTFFDPIMWGMTVWAVGLPPGYIIAYFFIYLVFIARNGI